ncbi:hypothetical protein [Microbacterium sp. No. 7]|uniref:hypothetical protein n=1 Tax=Microbacterium sp. No. 7 TaxID=1714373 RepID=UPI0006D2BAAF|nr:hypothetical protein [Microbacterium sp. No. 7]ALJ19761.1 hypothetical protein AOA12_07520 [Microbacterium sp. No. 7]
MTEESQTARSKKVVKASTAAPAKAPESEGPAWTPTPEAKKKAVTFRWIAAGLWAVAIAAELFALFWLLRQVPFTTAHTIWLIVAFVVIGALALGGSWLWKKANRLDPASEKDRFRFFVQNQLGAIITVIAFLPLIIVVLLSKNLNGTQKAVAGVIGVVVAGLVFWQSADWAPVSQEQYASETQQIIAITGQDQVYWTPAGKVFHLCEEARYVNLESEANEIRTGTVAQAYAEGKRMPAQQTIKQESNECGFTFVEPSDAPADDTPADDTEPAGDEPDPAETP